MNKYLYTALVALVCVGCQKQVTEVPPPTPEPTPIPTPTPAPVVVATPPPATPAPELAPPGVFYLTSTARIETADGIVGLPPGTGVKLIRPGIYLTLAGETPLADEQLTNDLAVARRARDTDRAVQAAAKQQLAEAVSQAKVVDAIASVESNAGHQAALAEIEKKRLEARMGALDRQRQELSVQKSALMDKWSREGTPGRINASTTEQQIKILSDQIKSVDRQIADARKEFYDRR